MAACGPRLAALAPEGAAAGQGTVGSECPVVHLLGLCSVRQPMATASEATSCNEYRATLRNGPLACCLPP